MKYKEAHKLTKQKLSLGEFKRRIGTLGRQGQTKIMTKPRIINGVKIPPGWYIKGDHMFKYNAAKDFNRQALVKRSEKDLGYYRGDLKPQGKKFGPIKSGRI